MRSIISRKLERGKVDVAISSEAIDSESATTINIPAAEQYKRQIEELSEALSLPLPEDWLATLLRLPDVLRTEIADADEKETASLQQAVECAIDRLVEFRTQEGNRLETFFIEKIQAIQSLLEEVPQYEEERVSKIKKRIQDTLEKLGDVDYDKNRFEQEMIFYIEKLDITEEKIRLQNHLDYFLSTLKNGYGQGKKLGFIAQEMGREINTLGSKANQAELQKIVVRMKDQLEQIKEQVLNVM